MGATRFTVPGKRSKEGDTGLKPAGTRDGRNDWPSLMVEVGYSESLQLLQYDARWWLEHTKGQTNMVIIIRITKNPYYSIRLECWEMSPGSDQGSARSRPSRSLSSASFSISTIPVMLPTTLITLIL